MNKKEKKLEMIFLWGIIAFFLLVTLLLLTGSVFNSNYQEHKIEKKCWNDTKVWSMYNGVKAQQLGISDEDMVNITYAYLYNYSIWTPEGIEDKFIEIPIKKCCYSIYEKGSGGIGEWYCKEQISNPYDDVK